MRIINFPISKDTEKIQALIDKQRTILADVAYFDLDDVAKIVNSFENPKYLAYNEIRVEKAYFDQKFSDKRIITVR